MTGNTQSCIFMYIVMLMDVNRGASNFFMATGAQFLWGKEAAREVHGVLLDDGSQSPLHQLGLTEHCKVPH